MKNVRKVLVCAALCLVALPGVWAGSTLHIGPGAGDPCAMGCGGHPNVLLDADEVDVFQNAGGAPYCVGSTLLIIGVPNRFQDKIPAMPITEVTAINEYPGGAETNGTADFAAGGTFGLKDPISDGYFGNMIAGEEVYSFLGLPDANDSNNFTNWSTALRNIVHVKATSFAIHVYALDANLIGGKGLIDIGFVENVPKGSIVVAYCQDAFGMAYSTPFTEAGIKTGY
jgi:hypothetical protein